jgi:hypothetical protein
MPQHLGNAASDPQLSHRRECVVLREEPEILLLTPSFHICDLSGDMKDGFFVKLSILHGITWERRGL